MLIPKGPCVLTSAFHSALLPPARGPFIRRHWKLSLQVCVKCPTTASVQEGTDAPTAWEAWAGGTRVRTPRQAGPALAAAVPGLDVSRSAPSHAVAGPGSSSCTRVKPKCQSSKHTADFKPHTCSDTHERDPTVLFAESPDKAKRKGRESQAPLQPAALNRNVVVWCLTLILIKISLREEKRSLQNHSEGSMQTSTVKLRTGNKSSLLQIFQGAGGAGMAHRPGTNYSIQACASTT